MALRVAHNYDAERRRPDSYKAGGNLPPDSAPLGKFKQQTKHQPTQAASNDESEATNQPIYMHVTIREQVF